MFCIFHRIPMDFFLMDGAIALSSGHPPKIAGEPATSWLIRGLRSFNIAMENGPATSMIHDDLLNTH